MYDSHHKELADRQTQNQYRYVYVFISNLKPGIFFNDLIRVVVNNIAGFFKPFSVFRFPEDKIRKQINVRHSVHCQSR